MPGPGSAWSPIFQQDLEAVFMLCSAFARVASSA